MTRLLRSFALAAALVGLLAIVACDGEGGEGTPTTQATTSPTSIGDEGEGTPAAGATAAPTTPAGGAIEWDIDPETTGNTASTLGTLERCARVDVPSPGFDGVSDYNIDVVVFGDTLAPQTYDAYLNYSDTSLVHIADPGTDEAIKFPGSPFCLTDPLPDSDGEFAVGCAYLSGGPGTAGNGIITRVGLDIDGTKSGLVTFTLNPPPQTAYGDVPVAAVGPREDQDTQCGNAIDDDNDTVVDDGCIVYHPITVGTGMLAINQDCPR